MAIFKITSATNRFSSTGDAFGPPADDTPGADTLIVDPNAFLISTDGNGAFLAATGAWTVSVNGTIVSQSPFAGIVLAPGNSVVSTIKIGADGQVQGGVGVLLASSANINNAGEIFGTQFGIQT